MKNPSYNALIAAGYISLVVLLITSFEKLPFSPEDNIFMPMGMLALLVLSVAIMAFLFFYGPAMLLVEGKKAEAVKLLVRTIGVFAIITVIILALAMFVFPFV